MKLIPEEKIIKMMADKAIEYTKIGFRPSYARRKAFNDLRIELGPMVKPRHQDCLVMNDYYLKGLNLVDPTVGIVNSEATLKQKKERSPKETFNYQSLLPEAIKMILDETLKIIDSGYSPSVSRKRAWVMAREKYPHTKITEKMAKIIMYDPRYIDSLNKYMKRVHGRETLYKINNDGDLRTNFDGGYKLFNKQNLR